MGICVKHDWFSLEENSRCPMCIREERGWGDPFREEPREIKADPNPERTKAVLDLYQEIAKLNGEIASLRSHSAQAFVDYVTHESQTAVRWTSDFAFKVRNALKRFNEEAGR